MTSPVNASRPVSGSASVSPSPKKSARRSRCSRGARGRAIEDDGEPRDGAWVAEITAHLDLRPGRGSRVIVRKERPQPGAQLSLFDMGKGCATPRPSARPAPADGS